MLIINTGRTRSDADFDDDIEDPIDAREIFDLIRNINDPGNCCLNINIYLLSIFDKITGIGDIFSNSAWETNVCRFLVDIVNKSLEILLGIYLIEF